MLDRSHAKAAVILLLPALLAFSLQWSLEVFHPVEEQRAAAHEHGKGGAVVYDPTACETGSHGPHFCPHSGAYARVMHLTSSFDIGALGVPRVSLPEAFVAPQVLAFSERGPPRLG